MNDETFFCLALSLVPGLGAGHIHPLLQQCGSASAVFTISRSELKRLRLSSEAAHTIAGGFAQKSAEEALRSARSKKIQEQRKPKPLCADTRKGMRHQRVPLWQLSASPELPHPQPHHLWPLPWDSYHRSLGVLGIPHHRATDIWNRIARYGRSPEILRIPEAMGPTI